MAPFESQGPRSTFQRQAWFSTFPTKFGIYKSIMTIPVFSIRLCTHVSEGDSEKNERNVIYSFIWGSEKALLS